MVRRRVKRRLKLGNIILAISLLCLVFLVGIYFFKKYNFKDSKLDDIKKKVPIIVKEPE